MRSETDPSVQAFMSLPEKVEAHVDHHGMV
jgi:hypothetical protein